MFEPRVHVLYENPSWELALTEALSDLGVSFRLIDLDAGMVNFWGLPPGGIYYRRMSSSTHTREHRYAAELTACFLQGLESHNRLVANGRPALRMELSTMAQYVAFEAHELRTPRTIVPKGHEQVLAPPANFNGTFITKHNRACQGLGVYRHESLTILEAFLYGGHYEEPIDGVTLVQEYVTSHDDHITRCEFGDGRFLYTLRADASERFELYPAQACGTDYMAYLSELESPPKFQVDSSFANPLCPHYERSLNEVGIDIAGNEFIVDAQVRTFTYDINPDTNYNRAGRWQPRDIYGMNYNAARATPNTSRTPESSPWGYGIAMVRG